MYFIIFFTTFFCTLFLQLWIRFFQQNRSVFHLKGPKSYFLIGNIDLLVFRNDILGYLNKYLDIYPKIFKTWFGSQLVIGINDGELARKVLTAPKLLHRPVFYDVLDTPLGLVGAKLELWKTHRKILNPTMSTKMLQTFLTIFNEHSSALVVDLYQYADGEEFDVLSVIIKRTLDEVCETTMGTYAMDFHTKKIVQETIHKFLWHMANRIGNVVLHPKIIYRLTRFYKDETVLRNYLYNFTDNIILAKKKMIETTPKLSKTDELIIKPEIFVNQLVAFAFDANSQISFTDAEIREECVTLIIAGTEASAITTAFCLLALAMNPNVQAKVAKEIVENYPANNDPLDFENLKNFPYLDLVIKETLRMYPGVPLVARLNVETDFDLGPITIKPNTTIAVDIFSMHRRKDVWGNDALEFRPERFLPENLERKHSVNYLPFSVGARNCFGNRYAILSIKMMLIRILKNYKFTTSLQNADMESFEFRFAITLKFLTKHLVKMDRRAA